MTTDRPTILRDFYRLFYNERRFTEGAALLSPGFVNHHPGAHGVGRQGMVDGFTRLGPPPSFHIAPVRMVADGDLIWVLSRATGVGPCGGLAVDLWRFDGDEIAEHWDVYRPIEPGEDVDALLAGLLNQ